MSIINNLTSDAATVGAYDIVYNGDMGAWSKFANTLKLKMLVQESGISARASYITSAMPASSTSADFIGVGEGALANPGYLNSANHNKLMALHILWLVRMHAISSTITMTLVSC